MDGVVETNFPDIKVSTPAWKNLPYSHPFLTDEMYHPF
jgi:hypothetical protein